MSLTELLPLVDRLSVDDKRSLRDQLNAELNRARIIEELMAASPLNVGGFHDCYEAAHAMSKMLEERNAKRIELFGKTRRRP